MIDGEAPSGSLVRTTAPDYTQQGRATQFGIRSETRNVRPAFGDLDDDGDLDLLVGTFDGVTRFYRNTGSASDPAYTQHEVTIGISDIGAGGNMTLADIDDDGDLDLFIGNRNRIGKSLFFRNSAAPGATIPAYVQEGGDEPFGIPDIGQSASPAFADIDNDGDLDLFIGEFYGNTRFYRNNAAPGANTPVYIQEGGDKPFGIADVWLVLRPGLGRCRWRRRS